MEDNNMEFKAYVRYKESNKVDIITTDSYTTKKSFEQDLRGNGYSIRCIATPEKFDEACDKWHENNELVARIEKIKHQYNKEQAEKYGCSVSVYKKAYKTWMEKDENGDYRYNAMGLTDWIEHFSNK